MSTVYDDPRIKFVKSLNREKCRVVLSTKPIVLLCGGKVPTKERASDPDVPTNSLRHAISNASTKFEIFRPEEIPEWHSDGVFSDLVSFELELASICSLVVLVPESAGSLVELGAFSQLQDLSKKMIVITSSKLYSEKSFINLGVLRFLNSNHDGSVKQFPWKVENPQEITSEMVSDIISDIDSKLSSLPQTQVLKITEKTHVAVLICTLLKHFTVLKETEIVHYLNQFDVIVPAEQIKGKLFVLMHFKIIKKVIYSDAIFYANGDEPFHTFNTALKDGHQKYDLIRVKMECIDYYQKHDVHRNRTRAIKLMAQRYG